MKKKKKPEVELLSPAGSFTTLKAVAAAGADAAYGAGNRFGARAYADNFSEEELQKAIDFMHLHGRSFYLTVNTLLKERELETELYDYIEPLYLQGLDGAIVQDLGVLSFLHKCFPDMELHASTQMSITGSYGARMMKDLGCSRIVTARELSLPEIRDIYENVDIEIESFIHGSLCYCYSGQCLFSSMLGGRSGNRGRCAQPCRLPYEIKLRGCRDSIAHPQYLLSPKDLCTIEMLPSIIESGVHALKIEGRMKQEEYAAGVTAIYRKYLDKYLNQPKGDYKVSVEDLTKLEDLGSRSGFTKGYYMKRNGPDMMSFEKPSHIARVRKKKLQEQVQFHDLKEKIKGILILSKGFPAKLVLKCKEVEITVTGDIVQKATNSPLDQKTVESKIRKTGNSAFIFGCETSDSGSMDSLKVTMDEDIFIPIGSLNKLRREGLEKLAEAFTSSHKRNPRRKARQPKGINDCREGWKNDVFVKKSGDKPDCPSAIYQTAKPYLAVSIEDLAQYKLLLDLPFISRIYVDCGAFPNDNKNLEAEMIKMAVESHDSGKELYYAMPFLFRKDTAGWYEKKWDFFRGSGLDGFIARNFEELEFLKARKWEGAKIISDSNLYAWSGEAGRCLKKMEVHNITLPLELNQRELKQRGALGGELIIYGHIPLMASAQCLLKNQNASKGCMQKNEKTIYLKDRYAKEFPVKNQCGYCYNIIYNSTPVSLLHQYQEVREIRPSGLRISFTIEPPMQMAQILKFYDSAFNKMETLEKGQYLKDYTHGHFKRGVE